MYLQITFGSAPGGRRIMLSIPLCHAERSRSTSCWAESKHVMLSGVEASSLQLFLEIHYIYSLQIY